MVIFYLGEKKKTREPRAEQRKKKRKERCSEDTRDKKQGN